jgi:hypothetical protein
VTPGSQRNASAGTQSTNDRAQPEPQHFWEKAEWREVLPDTVLAHHAFRLKGKKSCERKWKYQRIALLLVTASIPVVAAADGSRVLIAALGAIATFLAGVGELFRWRDNFIRENRSIMQIQRELVMWKTGREPYRQHKINPNDALPEDADELIVRVEEIVQTEGEGWATSIARASGEKSA